MPDDITRVDGSQIMALSTMDAQALFPGSAKRIRARFAALSMAWHPDHCARPDAGEVFAKLVELRNAALEMLAGRKPAGSRTADQRSFHFGSGGEHRFTVLSAHSWAIGERLVGRRSIVTVFAAGDTDLIQRATDVIGSLRFADDRMRREMSRFLPGPSKRIDLADGSALLVTPRPRGHLLLSDLMAEITRRGQTLDARHAAWITSGLMNIAAWLEFTQLMHGAIDETTVAVDPETHDVALLAGWEMACPFSERPTIATERALALVPGMALPGASASPVLDRLLIRDLFRRLVGNPDDGQLMSKGPPIPAPLARWIVMPPADNAIEDYRSWLEALTRAWGPRVFLKLEIDEADVYGARCADGTSACSNAA